MSFMTLFIFFFASLVPESFEPQFIEYLRGKFILLLLHLEKIKDINKIMDTI